MWSLIFWIRSGTFLIPAWVWGGFWFAGEVFSLATQSSGGVAVMAHIGGFLFGFTAAVALQKSGYEMRALAPAVQRKTTWTQHAGTDEARKALERGDSRAAADAYRTVVKDRPLDREAAVGLSRIEQDPRAAVVLLHALASKGEIAQAWEVAIELGPLFDPDKMPDRLCYQLAGADHPPEGAADLPERLDAAVGRRKGPLAAKALLRAAKRCLGCGRAEQGQAYLAEAALHVELAPGKMRRVEFSRLVGVAAGVVANGEGASILTDFVLSWGEGAEAPSTIRIAGAQLGLAAIYPGVPPKQAYTKLMAHVLARVPGDPLPSREALAKGEYPKFPSIAALNAAFYGARG